MILIYYLHRPYETGREVERVENSIHVKDDRQDSMYPPIQINIDMTDRIQYNLQIKLTLSFLTWNPTSKMSNDEIWVLRKVVVRHVVVFFCQVRQHVWWVVRYEYLDWQVWMSWLTSMNAYVIFVMFDEHNVRC